MRDLIHKILYTGIGFAALTEEKAHQLVAELEQRGEVSSEEGKKLAAELVEKARKHGEELRKTVNEEIERLAKKFKWVSRDEFDNLKRRLEHLEAQAGITTTGDADSE